MPRPQITFDQLSKVPIWRQLAGQMREWILSGEVAPGDPVWSIRDIQQEAGVARGTARQALAALEQEGLVVMIRGRGTLVAPRDD